MHPNFTIKNLLPKRKRFVRLTAIIYFYVQPLNSTIMNTKKLRIKVEMGETLSQEGERQLIALGEVELFKVYIQKHFIHPNVEPELLKSSSQDLLTAYLENGNWLSASAQKLMLEDEYIAAFKLYTSSRRLKKKLFPELISPQHLLQFEIYFANGNYLDRDAENLLLRPENQQVLAKCAQKHTLSKDFQRQLFLPQYRAQFETYIQYRQLSPCIEGLLLRPENMVLFMLYNKRRCLKLKNQIKMLEINRPELTQTFLKKWRIDRRAKVRIEEKLAENESRLTQESTASAAS